MGFQQHSPYHAYDVFTHIAHVVQTVPPELPLRWAALLHDIGKPACFTSDETGRGHFLGHAKVSGQIADTVLRRLKSPTVLREQVVFLVEHHMTPLEPDKKLLLRRLGKYGTEGVLSLLTLQEADMGSKGTGKSNFEETFVQIHNLLEEIFAEDACLTISDLAIDGRDLIALGFTPGPQLGQCLAGLLEQVQNEVLPNEKSALLQKAKKSL